MVRYATDSQCQGECLGISSTHLSTSLFHPSHFYKSRTLQRCDGENLLGRTRVVLGASEGGTTDDGCTHHSPQPLREDGEQFRNVSHGHYGSRGVGQTAGSYTESYKGISYLLSPLFCIITLAKFNNVGGNAICYKGRVPEFLQLTEDHG